jgi:hypothetical protein
MSSNGDTHTATAHLEAYAQRQRHLADQLRAHGLDRELDVPKIVIIGSQSAGEYAPGIEVRVAGRSLSWKQARAAS